MDSKTFPDSRVRETIEKNFVAVRIDTDKDRETPARYRISGIPALFILDENGQVLDQALGFVPPDSLLDLLNKHVRR
ncbi:MAG: hypothetical protein C4521_03500 [Actinobacteria bacterium]|nr:MAG: hypothetical protein C4521_03500 [Actinomycetota bacterium]